MAFVAPPGHDGYHTTADTYVDANGQIQQHHHYAVNPTSAMQDAAKGAYYGTNLPPPQMSCDIKPRLTKEQHDILEAHFQKQNKPSTNIKKGFAENLNVSLDKVNNWFQNRRAKSKQDAKKQAGAYSLYAQQQQQASSTALNFSSDSDTSPTFAPPAYYAMMQQCPPGEQASNGAGFVNVQQFEEQTHSHGLPYSNSMHSGQQYNTNNLMPLQAPQDMFDSPQDINRRTLTQEQFDAFQQGGGMMQSSQFDSMQHQFTGDANMLPQDFSNLQQTDYKEHDFAFPPDLTEPLSSSDSSIPSTISEQSMFPSSTAMQDHVGMSSTSSDWADSRSSSVSNANDQSSPFHTASMQQQQQLPTTQSAQWRPGQSVPVDAKALQQQFEDAQRQAQQYRQQIQEEPLPWSADEAFVRRDSQTGTVLANQLDQFAIQTPQPPQNSTFKIPTPSSHGDIASRRQRNRPAQLSVGLRSQSYSGAGQPASPGQQSHSIPPGQQIRKIRSHNVINGGVVQGRVMKSTPGSAQRSPMSWTFADAISSNNASRHASMTSNGNLAPPTPLSPSEGSRPEQQRPAFPSWQSSSGTFSRQASISEQDAEYNVVHNAGQAGQAKNFTSPPHTPMYHHHQQQPMAHRIGNGVHTEYTPPQSAPAIQTTFPANAFMPPPPQPAPQAQTAQVQYSQQAFASSQNSSYMGQATQGQPFQAYNPATQQYSVPASEAPETHMQFAQGVPLVNDLGQLTMAFPPPMQSAQFLQRAPVQSSPQPQQYSFVSHSGTSPGVHITSQLPRQQQQPAEFFVHEYSPPSEIKRVATPCKVHVDNGPKNFTFANQGIEHFEKERAKKADAKAGTASNSPDSAVSSS